jgi:hypothetical protein
VVALSFNKEALILVKVYAGRSTLEPCSHRPEHGRIPESVARARISSSIAASRTWQQTGTW